MGKCLWQQSGEGGVGELGGGGERGGGGEKTGARNTTKREERRSSTAAKQGRQFAPYITSLICHFWM
jgi:hypothetical protein